MRKKLEHMTAETFLTFVRMRRLFRSDAICVTGDLTVRDPDLDYLCGTLRVKGNLDLSGCTSLEALPDRLTVVGDLIIDRCVKLRRLPRNLRKVKQFSAKDCVALQSLSSLKFCADAVFLTGCIALKPLSPDFRGTTLVWIDGCLIHWNALCLEMILPDTIMIALPGRRVGELIDHRLLADHPIRDAIITEVDVDEIFGETRLSIDSTSLVKERPLWKG